MSSLTIVLRDGEERSVAVTGSPTLMEVIRNAGVDELMALCGGCCACATCHVLIDPDYAAHLPPMSEDENDLLDSSDNRRENSRLSCQIKFNSALTGARIMIAEED
jgi:ferredoxin, 2Fe-2S